MRTPITLLALLTLAGSLSAQDRRSVRERAPRTQLPDDRRGEARPMAPGGRPEGAEVRAPRAMPRREALPPMRSRLADSAGYITWTARPRLTMLPTVGYWREHDLMDQIRMHARHGFVPVEAFPADATSYSHYAMFSTGWRVYGFLVPPGGTVRVDLQHDKPAWFQLRWADRWGEYRPGMRIKLGEPSALYENPENTVQAVYLVVDDPGQWSNEKDPYLLKVQRSWDPKTFDPQGASLVVGIWNTPNRFMPEFR
jgi:hypothetical protein